MLLFHNLLNELRSRPEVEDVKAICDRQTAELYADLLDHERLASTEILSAIGSGQVVALIIVSQGIPFVAAVDVDTLGLHLQVRPATGGRCPRSDRLTAVINRCASAARHLVVETPAA